MTDKRPLAAAVQATAIRRLIEHLGKPFWVGLGSLATISTLVVTLYFGVYSANNDPVKAPEPTPPTSPSASSAQRSASPAPSASEGDMPPPPKTTTVLRSGSGTINADDGGSHGPGEYGYLADVRVSGFPYGLTVGEGSILAPYPGGSRPGPADCSRIRAAAWGVEALTQQLRTGATFCLLSGDKRYGYLTVRDTQLNNVGDMESVSFTFVIWEGPKD